jgi:hypothetical protein
VSKMQPSVGDVGVVGIIDCLTRNPLGSSAFFVAEITANGYSSVAQNLFVPALSYCCKDIPDGIETGDTVTASIVETDDGVAYATNILKL